MIPKIIHYIWLGGNPLPEMVIKCMESWKRFCPDYEIKRWDESNLDIDFCKYCRDAYNAKKYAFASDALRFKVIKENGGIYLDVDVELLRPLDDFLYEKCFMGYEMGEELTINPGFAGQKMVKSTVEKVKKIMAFLREKGKENLIVEVDGNITPENGKLLSNLGTSMFVCGSSSVFKGQVKDYENNIRNFRKCIEL